MPSGKAGGRVTLPAASAAHICPPQLDKKVATKYNEATWFGIIPHKPQGFSKNIAHFCGRRKEAPFAVIIQEENLKEEETRKFIEAAFRDGSVKTTGTDIDKLMLPLSRFGGGNRVEKKQGVIAKLLAFFERFFEIG